MFYLKKTIIGLIFFSPFFGSSQWTEIPCPADNSLYCIDIHESGVCFAGGIDLIKSDDFGLTWQEVLFTGPFALVFDNIVVNSIAVLNDSTIVCAGWSGFVNNTNAIMRSTDYGITWTMVYFGPDFTGHQFYHVEFFDELKGIAVGSAGLIFRTTDGGITWSQVASGTSAKLNDVAYSSEFNVVVVGIGVTLHSTIGGLSWTPTLQPGLELYSVKFNPDDNLYSVTGKSTTSNDSYWLSSANFGATWNSQFMSPDYVDVHEVLTGDTVIISLGSELHVSFNEAVDFFQYTPVVGAVQDIEFLNGVGLAVTNPTLDGRVYRYNYSLPFNANPIVNFNYVTSLCAGDIFTYQASNLSLDSYEWFVNGVSVATGSNFTYNHPTTGATQIKLVVTYNGNSYTIIHNVSVTPALTIVPFVIAANTTCCYGSSLFFWINELGGSTGYQVYANGVPVSPQASSGNNKNYNIGPITVPTTFDIVKWAINACDSIGITGSFTVNPEVFENPNTDFYALDSAVCYAQTSQLIIPETEAGYIYKLYKDGVFLISAIATGDSLFLPSGLILGTHTYTIKVNSPGASCLTNLLHSEQITVAVINSDFTLTPAYFEENQNFFINTTAVVGTQFLWEVTGAPSVFTNTNTLNPIIQFDTVSYESLTLHAQNDQGCVDSTTLPFTVFNSPPDSTTDEICWLYEKDLPTSVIESHVDIFGNLILLGYRLDGPPFYTSTNYFANIQKYDPDGNLLWEWEHEYTGTNQQEYSTFGSVTSDEFGNIYLTGAWIAKVFKYQDTILYSGTETRKSFLMKVDPMGDIVWYYDKAAASGHSGFGCIRYNYQTHHLFMSASLLSTYVALNGINYPLPGAPEVVILQMDTNGNALNHFGIDTHYSNLKMEDHPWEPHSNESTVTGPEIFIHSDSTISVIGDFKNKAFQIGTFSTPENFSGYTRFFAANLEPYGTGSGWTAVKVIPYKQDESYISANQFRSKATIDTDHNLYVSINAIYNNQPWNAKIIIEGDTLFGESSYIIKLDSSLNYVWHKRFEPTFIIDVAYAKDSSVFFVGESIDYFASWNNNTEASYLLNPSGEDNIVFGTITTNGTVTWLEDIGQGAAEMVYPIASNHCGDLFFSGRCTVQGPGPNYTWNTRDTFNLEISGINYGEIYGGFIFKLGHTECIAGGCATLCNNPAYLPNPVIIDTGFVLQTSPYSTYQWYLDGIAIPGATNQSYPYLTNGTYTVEVTDILGCSGLSLPELSCTNPLATTIDYTDTTIWVNGSYFSYQWYLNGVEIPGETDSIFNYTQNGNYTVVVTDSAGCSEETGPSISCLNLNLFTDPIVTFTSTQLSTGLYNTYQWFLNGNPIAGATNQNYSYTQNGNYSVEVTDTNGCSGNAAVDTTCLNAGLVSAPPIYLIGTSLSTNVYTSYQWYFNGALIPGANNQSFTFTQNGNYTVSIVDVNGCSAQSFPYTISGLGNNENSDLIGLQIYPNPTSGEIQIVLNKTSDSAIFELFDVSGKKCDFILTYTDDSSRYSADLGTLSRGIYTIRLTVEGAYYFLKIVKE